MCELSSMSNLRTYLSAQSLSQTDFAKLLGISKSYLSEIASGSKVPGLALALKIQAQTQGVVALDSFGADARDKASPPPKVGEIAGPDSHG